MLSRVNILAQTFEGEKETIAKVYHILKSKSELADILANIQIQQRNDPKILQIIQRLAEHDERIMQYYCTYNNILFTKTKQSSEQWKAVIPKIIEKEIAVDYHVRCLLYTSRCV